MIVREFVFFAMLTVMPAIGDGQTSAVDPAPPPVVQSEKQVALLPLIPNLPKPEVPKPEFAPTEDHPICRVGALVMIPDGREGRVTSRVDNICRVLAYGEGYVSLWLVDMVEPVYPQQLPRYVFGH